MIEVLRGLPSFVLLAVRAPLEVRFRRALARGRAGRFRNQPNPGSQYIGPRNRRPPV